MMDVAIYCGTGWQQWGPGDIETVGLGGSETAAVRLAEELHRTGHQVTVYGEVQQEGGFSQVRYRHHGMFDPAMRRDAVICSRSPKIYDRKINTDHNFFWMHDADYDDRLNPRRAVQIDHVMVVSEWHRTHVVSRYPWIADKVRVTRNGIEPSYFVRPDDLTRIPRRAIYSSGLNRGLETLLEWWPAVRERVPDAELAYCSSRVYDVVVARRPGLLAQAKRIRSMAVQPGVMSLGSLSQSALAREMMRSGVWLLPSWSDGEPFNETYCIGAVEAAAAGCRLVMGRTGALSERTEGTWAWWLEVPPEESEWVDAVASAMTSKAAYHASETALATTWHGVAEDFLRLMT